MESRRVFFVAHMFSSSKICIANLRSGSLTLGELEAVSDWRLLSHFLYSISLICLAGWRGLCEWCRTRSMSYASCQSHRFFRRRTIWRILQCKLTLQLGPTSDDMLLLLWVLKRKRLESAEASLELSITDVWSFFKLLDSDMEAEISPDSWLHHLHPRKLTWNLRITCLKRKIIF